MKNIYIFILTFVLVGCSSLKVQQTPYKSTNIEEKEPVAVTVEKRSLHIVGLGDSLTQGVGDKEKSGYIGRIQQRLLSEPSIREVTISNFGKKGDKTTNLLKKLKKEKVREEIKKADYIFITIGANDMMNIVRQNIFSLTYEPFDREQALFAERLEEIITTIRFLNEDAHIYYIGLYNPFYEALPDFPEIDLIIEKWNESAKSVLLNDVHATFVSVQSDFEYNGEEPLLANDQFHPNEKGYAIIAEKLYEALLQDGKM